MRMGIWRGRGRGRGREGGGEGKLINMAKTVWKAVSLATRVRSCEGRCHEEDEDKRKMKK
jgi:hypothetical protein